MLQLPSAKNTKFPRYFCLSLRNNACQYLWIHSRRAQFERYLPSLAIWVEPCLAVYTPIHINVCMPRRNHCTSVWYIFNYCKWIVECFVISLVLHAKRKAKFLMLTCLMVLFVRCRIRFGFTQTARIQFIGSALCWQSIIQLNGYQISCPLFHLLSMFTGSFVYNIRDSNQTEEFEPYALDKMLPFLVVCNKEHSSRFSWAPKKSPDSMYIRVRLSSFFLSSTYLFPFLYLQVSDWTSKSARCCRRSAAFVSICVCMLNYIMVKIIKF